MVYAFAGPSVLPILARINKTIYSEVYALIYKRCRLKIIYQHGNQAQNYEKSLRHVQNLPRTKFQNLRKLEIHLPYAGPRAEFHAAQQGFQNVMRLLGSHKLCSISEIGVFACLPDRSSRQSRLPFGESLRGPLWEVWLLLRLIDNEISPRANIATNGVKHIFNRTLIIRCGEYNLDRLYHGRWDIMMGYLEIFLAQGWLEHLQLWVPPASRHDYTPASMSTGSVALAPPHFPTQLDCLLALPRTHRQRNWLGGLLSVSKLQRFKSIVVHSHDDTQWASLSQQVC